MKELTQEILEPIYDELQSAICEGKVRKNVTLSQLTTFKIGGPVPILVEPASVQEAQACARICSKHAVEMRVIGCGSNILVADAGISCVLLKFGEAFANISISGTTITAQAGATNENVANAALEANLTGYEFASGIPGSIGGAAVMNAGAYDGEFSQVASSIQCMTTEGELVEIPAEEADFGYRHSKMMAENLIVLSAKLELSKGNHEEIAALMADLKQRRESKQPLEMPSAGSTFKRPEGYFAGKLIQDAGLKGYRVGGAMVSEKHSGFVVNAGGATAADVMQLITDVQNKVYEHEGVKLEPEVRLWGF